MRHRPQLALFPATHACCLSCLGLRLGGPLRRRVGWEGKTSTAAGEIRGLALIHRTRESTLEFTIRTEQHELRDSTFPFRVHSKGGNEEQFQFGSPSPKPCTCPSLFLGNPCVFLHFGAKIRGCGGLRLTPINDKPFQAKRSAPRERRTVVKAPFGALRDFSVCF